MKKTRLMLALGGLVILQACSETTIESNQQATEPPPPSTSVTAMNPEAILSPKDKLQADTIAATEHDRSASKIPYIGAWAASPDGCALIDQSVYDSFAVITPTSIRQFEEGCTYTPPPLQSNVHQIQATCTAEGETSQRTIRIEVVNSETIRLSNIEGRAGTEMYRCNHAL